MGEHAKLSPSSAERWSQCWGSAVLPAPPQEESIHMAQGTAAHTMFEKGIERGIAPKTWTGIKGVDVTPEMKQAVDDALYNLHNEILAKCKEPDVYTEFRLTARQIDPSIWGTADVIVDALNALWVIDYKNGVGVEVEVKDNPQLEIYGLGALAEFGFDDRPLHMCILQPRARSGKRMKVWTIEAKEVKAWEEATAKRYKKAVDCIKNFDQLPRGQRFTSGEHCGWCKVKSMCPRIIEQAVLAVSLDPGKIREVSKDTLVSLFRHQKQIKDVLEEAHKAVSIRALSGETVPGYKLVHSVTSRKIVDEEKVKGLLHDCGWQPDEYLVEKLRPLSVLDKLAGKDFVDMHSVKPSPKTILVPDSDKRPTVEDARADDFEDLEEPKPPTKGKKKSGKGSKNKA